MKFNALGYTTAKNYNSWSSNSTNLNNLILRNSVVLQL